MCFVFIILLPMMAMMYLDILQAKHETEHQQQQIQKLINEKKEK
jgi:preprotein translocase subunit YajC